MRMLSEYLEFFAGSEGPNLPIVLFCASRNVKLLMIPYVLLKFKEGGLPPP